MVAANLEEEGGGLEVTRMLRDLQPGIKVVLLVEELQREIVVAAFRAGAMGVFGRSEPLMRLWKCICCVHADQIWAGSRELHFVLEAFQKSIPPRLVNDQGLTMLSEQEQKVVRYVCEGLTNREIAERMGLSEHTIKNHLFRVYTRLGVSSRVEVMFSVLSQHVVRAPQVAQAPSSDEELFQMYLKQAEHSVMAQYLVGRMYIEGRGTSKDVVTGYMWLTLAQQTGREIFNECSLAKNQLAAEIKGEDKTEAENRAAKRLQPSWRSSWRGVVSRSLEPQSFRRRAAQKRGTTQTSLTVANVNLEQEPKDQPI